jgi:16S rRNA (adenine1518-N6/adenine1519-N6)-dimethyltransferase
VVDIYPSPLIKEELLDSFFKLVKAGFSQKRKTLRNSLSSGLHISPAGAAELLTRVNIDPQRRAETLSIQEWERLAEIT